MDTQHTFVMVKPDGVRRGLVAEVIGRFERKGLILEQMRMLTVDDGLAGRHYAEHTEKSFFAELVSFITSGPVVAMEWSGPDAVSIVRTLIGSTDPAEAPPGTIRGDLGTIITENIVHGSDSLDSAEREIQLFFS
jgi:nucleoside-diphosphate kinase